MARIVDAARPKVTSWLRGTSKYAYQRKNTAALQILTRGTACQSYGKVLSIRGSI